MPGWNVVVYNTFNGAFVAGWPHMKKPKVWLNIGGETLSKELAYGKMILAHDYNEADNSTLREFRGVVNKFRKWQVKETAGGVEDKYLRRLIIFNQYSRL